MLLFSIPILLLWYSKMYLQRMNIQRSDDWWWWILNTAFVVEIIYPWQRMTGKSVWSLGGW